VRPLGPAMLTLDSNKRFRRVIFLLWGSSFLKTCQADYSESQPIALQSAYSVVLESGISYICIDHVKSRICRLQSLTLLPRWFGLNSYGAYNFVC
jgi:hypothetical protein